MPKSSSVPAWQRAVVALSATVIGVTIVGALYWAQMVFIPLALAIFFTFLLNPMVRALQRWGLGRVPAVLTVVLWAALLLGALGWLMSRQVGSLLTRLPDYTQNIKDKVRALRTSGGGLARLSKMVEEISDELTAPAAGDERAAGPRQPAVVIRDDLPGWVRGLPGYIGPLAHLLGEFALTVVLTVFMLLNREDLRARFLRLVARGRVPATTKAVDDAGNRVSRFLLTQAMLNGGFGLFAALGLWAIGVEYFVLWGVLAALMRYIPYLGTWIAALFPFTLSVAMLPQWWAPLAVFGLFLALELISANVFEPWLFGQSIGVSGVAQLVSAAFWAFLWGPVGLVLAAPMTVVLLVLGKYVPQLEFLSVLLGDEPALEPDVAYYQRLLARDPDEAAELVLSRAKEPAEAEQVYDELLVPALTYARRDRERGDLTDEDAAFVMQETREVLDDLGEQRPAAPDGPPDGPPVRVLACPARGDADQLVLEMLPLLLEPGRWSVEVTAADLLGSEMVEQAAENAPAMILVGALPPGGLARTRYLCKRLRARFPDVKIVVGRWGLTAHEEENREQFREAGADLMTTSLLETRNLLRGWLPVLSREQATAAAG